MRFSCRVLCLAILTALAALPTAKAQQVTLQSYDPLINDAEVGQQVVAAGGAVTLTGPQQFAAGDSGSRDTTVGSLKSRGLILTGAEWLSAARLNPGQMNFGVAVPDPITGGNRVVSTYNSANLVDLAAFSDDTVLPDIVNVNGQQYIDARVGTVTAGGGTLNIDIGTAGAGSTASTNGWTMAAKQTSLFYADGTGGAASVLDWRSQNRITFVGEVGDPTQPKSFNVTSVAHYGGALSVTTADGVAHGFNVTDSASLRSYNDFLISQLRTGNLDPARYPALFAQAYSSSTETVTYGITADSPPDEVAQPIGDRIAMHLVGANASGTVASGALLEVVNANHGAVRAEQGATATIEGTLAAQHSSGDGSALVLASASHGTNNGVINGNFFGSSTVIEIPSGTFGSNVVDVQDGSDFTNNGVLNLATGAANGAGKSTGIRLGANAVATNAGSVNVGVTGSRSNGSMDGIYLADPSARFTNAVGGAIYIGRGPQDTVGQNTPDIGINQGTLTTGVNVAGGGTVRNLGNITIGSLVQNAAALFVASPGADVDNAGTIDINGRAATVPRENDGILVQNGGALGNVVNSGTINLGGVNGVGIKALSTAGVASLVRNTGTINVAGGADPASGTRNFGVWAEGQGAATAQAEVQGSVNLLGDGAIGIHARGRATVNVAAGAAPRFTGGTKQIGFYAFGNDAHINVLGGSALDVSTPQSTLFRVDSGADFDGTGLTMSVSGAQAVGVLGSGAGSVVNTRDAGIAVSGAGAQGVIVEGGAMGTIDAATTMRLTGQGAVAGIVDGQKHALTGADTGSIARSTSLTSLATLNSSATGVTGFIARHGASLLNAGTVGLTGANATAFLVESNAAATNNAAVDLSGPGATGALLRSGGTFANNASIHVGSGTGVRVEGAGTQRLNPAGTITVDDGVAGVQLVGGAGLMLGSGDSAIVTRGTAHGVLLDTGAASLVANGTTITTLGTGNAIENAAETGAITLTGATLRVGDGAGLRTATAIDPASTATFEVDGAGVGYAFRKADGSPAAGDLDIGPGFVVHGNGAGASGIQALTTGTVTTTASVDILHAAGGSALIAGTATSVTNAGVLRSASTVSPVVDLSNGGGTTFTNTGSVLASGPATQAVRGSAGNDAVTLSGGDVRGEVATGGGNDTFSWTGGTFDGGLTMGDGTTNTATVGKVDTSSTYHLLAGNGGDNTLTLDGTQARGGSFANDDFAKGIRVVGWNRFNLANGAGFTLTDDLTLAGSEVNIDASSTLFAGNGVHPVISATTTGAAKVTNAGTIDLTNGAGSPGNVLTVDGDYEGGPGRLKLVTALDEGGPLGAQMTDRLLVQGNATGETALDITAAAASAGGLTDTNRNGYVDAVEGISVVQVAGASSGGAFRVDGGYVAFGPWQYGLYAFQPGSSDAGQRVVPGGGNGFWDYRLANVLVCDGPCPPPTTDTPAATPPPGQAYVAPPPPSGPLAAVNARAAVVPQVPAYIVSPSALALANYRTIDNLHRRLGEIRDMEEGSPGLGGEPFVRYIAGDYSYATDRSFRDYGYDFDVDTRAVQVGMNILDTGDDRNTLRAGLAYTHGTTRIDPKAADGYSHAKLDTNAIAMMLTWQHANGFYVDAIVQGDRHTGDVDTARAKDVARVRGSGWTASLETGYPLRLDGWRLEPQLQVIRQHIGLTDQVDLDRVTTHYDAFDQTIGRAGLRLDRSWLTKSESTITPYARLNYLQGWGGGSGVAVGAEGYAFSQDFAGGTFGRAVELGLGGTYTTRNRLAIYGEADWQTRLGDPGARGWSANVGLRWDF